MSDSSVFRPGDIVHVIKATRSDGKDFHTGTINYGDHVGRWIEVDAAPYGAGQCAAGIHFSPRAVDCCRAMSGSGHRPWRFYELAVIVDDITWPRLDALLDSQKWRARRVYVVRELSHREAFGFDLSERTKRCREIAGTFAAIPWLRPERSVTEEEVRSLVSTWRERLTPYLASGSVLPSVVRLVRTREEASAAAAAAAAAVVVVGAVDGTSSSSSSPDSPRAGATAAAGAATSCD